MYWHHKSYRSSYTPSTTTQSAANSYNSTIKSSYTNGTSAAPSTEDIAPATPKKGAWRKEIAKFEDDLELNKVKKENQTKIESYTAAAPKTESTRITVPIATNTTTAKAVTSTTEEAPAKRVWSWQKKTEPEAAKTAASLAATDSKAATTYSWNKSSESKISTAPSVQTTKVEIKVNLNI